MKKKGLYDPWYEHDACGVGFVVNVNGQRSHQTVTDGLTILKNLVHRGAVGGDAKTGDGAGMLMQMPHVFFAKESELLRITLPDEGAYGVGMLFLPLDAGKRKAAAGIIESIVSAEGGRILGWRDVPVQPECPGVCLVRGPQRCGPRTAPVSYAESDRTRGENRRIFE
jgi:glutamate synthase domain-containing protein 1